MEAFELLFNTFGIEPGTTAALAGMLIVIVQFLKSEIPVLVGWKTTVVNLVVAFLLSWAVYTRGMPEVDWAAIFVSALLTWIFAAGGNSLLKKFAAGGRTQSMIGGSFRPKKSNGV